jgi:peptide/nickel transport system permease protein
MRILIYALAKLASAAGTMFGAAVLVFVTLRFIPGGYADMLLGPFATPEARAAIEQRFGLDRPAPEQFLQWLWALLHGDFGVSLVTQQPIIDEFLRRAPVTLELAALALGFALLVGLPLGVASGTAPPGSKRTTLARLLGALGVSVPDFVVGSALIFLFSVWPLWLKVGGFVPFTENPILNLRTMILPAATLGLFGAGLILRTTRDAVLRVMTEPYIAAAVARGETPGRIVRLHVLRNAAIPVTTVVTTYFGFLLSGAVVVEVLFSIPGVGLYAYNGLGNRDFGIVQAGVLLAAGVFVTINMAADLLYVVIDPRLAAP